MTTWLAYIEASDPSINSPFRNVFILLPTANVYFWHHGAQHAMYALYCARK